MTFLRHLSIPESWAELKGTVMPNTSSGKASGLSGTSSASKSLTKNQKKKRRQKLAKHFRGDGSTSAGSDLTSLESRASAATHTAAGSSPQHSHAQDHTSLSGSAEEAEIVSGEPSAHIVARQLAAAQPSVPVKVATASAPVPFSQQQDFSAAARCISTALDGAAGADTDSHAQARDGVSRRQYRHGNYRTYYGYRLGADFEEDPRLQVQPSTKWNCMAVSPACA